MLVNMHLLILDTYILKYTRDNDLDISGVYFMTGRLIKVAKPLYINRLFLTYGTESRPS